MWMMIFGQAVYQIVVALTLHFAGHAIFNFNSTDNAIKIDQDNELSTLVFNTFVFSQICAFASRSPAEAQPLTPLRSQHVQRSSSRQGNERLCWRVQERVLLGHLCHQYVPPSSLPSTSLTRRDLAVVGGQALIVSFGGAAFQVVKISGRDWLISIILGALALPLAMLIRLLPTAPFERFMIRFRLYPDPNAPLPTVNPAAEERQWNEGSFAVYARLPS